jgi:hypothetical protein
MRAITGTLALLLSLLLLLPVPARAGSVAGTVTDRTADEPVAGAQVVLFVSGSGSVTGQATSDDQGRFRFKDVGPGEYAIGVTHLEVPYVQRQIRITEASPDATADLQVYQTTTSDEAVSIRADHLLLQPSEDAVQVTEFVVFYNDGDRSYLGDASPASPTGHGLTLPLPEGYSELGASPGLQERIFSRSEAAFRLALPLAPGPTQISFTYRVPHGPLGARLDRRFTLAVQGVNVAVPEEGSWEVHSEDLGRTSTADLGERNFIVAAGGPFPEGHEIVARVSAGGTLGSGLPTGRAASALGGVLVAALGLAWILRQKGTPA